MAHLSILALESVFGGSDTGDGFKCCSGATLPPFDKSHGPDASGKYHRKWVTVLPTADHCVC